MQLYKEQGQSLRTDVKSLQDTMADGQSKVCDTAIRYTTICVESGEIRIYIPICLFMHKEIGTMHTKTNNSD